MSVDYFFFYAESNIVCIIILLMLLIHDRVYGTREARQLPYNYTVNAHILYFLSDIGWAAVLSGQLPRTRFLVILFNFLNFVFMSLLSYEWFRYMAVSEHLEIGKSRKQRGLILLPMMVALVVMVTIFLAEPNLLVSDSGELHFLYYPLLLAAPLIYGNTDLIGVSGSNSTPFLV